MQYEIKSLHERLGVTVVYVTHDQGEALTMSDRIAVFERGPHPQIADPETIYDRPDTIFVAEFIGETNRLAVMVGARGGREGGRCDRGRRRLVACAGPGVEAGKPACIMIRPERLGVAGRDGENRLSASVRDVIYHGDHRRLHLACEHLGAIVARIPARGGEARPGDTIDIGFSADDAQALPPRSHRNRPEGQNGSTSMRKTRIWSGAAALALGAAILALPAAAQRPLTEVSRGGAYQDAQKKVYFEPFKSAGGVEMIDESWDGGIGVLRSKVEGGADSGWDVVQVESEELTIGCDEGLYEPLDWSKIGGEGAYMKEAVSDCGVGAIVYDFVLGYDKDKLSAAPPGWADFFDTQKFPGKRALRQGPKTNLEIALMADGVAPKDVYES